MIDTNFIVDNEFRLGDEAELFFDGERIILVPSGITMFEILVLAGIFPSMGQAKKNWKGERDVPTGFSQILVGKLRNRITILQPTQDNLITENKEGVGP